MCVKSNDLSEVHDLHSVAMGAKESIANPDQKKIGRPRTSNMMLQVPSDSFLRSNGILPCEYCKQSIN